LDHSLARMRVLSVGLAFGFAGLGFAIALAL